MSNEKETKKPEVAQENIGAEEPQIMTVNYTRKNTFMNFEKIPDLKRLNEDGEEISSEPYVKTSAPKTKKYHRIPWDVRKNRWIIDLKKGEDLDRLVTNCSFAYETGPRKGEIIETANPRNRMDPFFNHKRLVFVMQSGQASIQPDDPVHKIFLKSFADDRRFKNAGEDKSGLQNAKVSWTISRSGEEEAKKLNSMEESMEAGELLRKMDRDKMIAVIRSMGMPISGDPTERQLRGKLFEKITVLKDQKTGPGGQRNIDAFMSYAKATNEDLKLREIITEAYDQNLIGMLSGNRYVYNKIEMGQSIDEVVQFLENPENKSVKDQIIRNTKL